MRSTCVVDSGVKKTRKAAEASDTNYDDQKNYEATEILK